MRDAIGGTFSISAIIIFLIIVNSFLAFSVNYTKAFRAKNEIRSIIEKNEGLTCNAYTQIEEMLSTSKYHIGTKALCDHLTGDYKTATGKNNTALFCYKVNKVDVAGSSKDTNTYKGAYYTIATFVNIDLPILRDIYAGVADVFKIEGETALIYSSGIDFDAIQKGKCSP